jgi:GNAT superfamily N-acetyltransferase
VSEPVITLQHRFYVANEKNEEIATVVLYWRHGVLWMTDVWVHGEHRRKGLATRMIEAAIAEFGHTTTYLNVLSYTNRPMSDAELLRWYHGFGFEPILGVPGAMKRPGSGYEHDRL